MRRLAHLVVSLASVFVPRSRRGEWLEEWRAELAALHRESPSSPAIPAVPSPGTQSGEDRRLEEPRPGPLAFSLGALPHALWTMKEEWTLDSLIQDLRYAGRVLWRAPGFTLVAALTLALGIGANASIFSLVNGLVFRPPQGLAEPERLVQIARSYESAPRWDNFSWPAMELIRQEASALSGVAGYQNQSFVLGRGEETEAVLGQIVTGDFFQVLGVRPFLGRLFNPADDLEPEAHPVVVLSHAAWEGRFGADPAVVGSTLAIGARPYEVVGVAPPGFAGVEVLGTPPTLWVPTMQRALIPGVESVFDQWGSSWIEVLGRLRDGVSFEEAQASMDVVSARLRAASPVNLDMEVLLAQGVGLDPEGRRQAQQMSLVLFVIVGVVLLLACTNVANLFLARATGRRTEVGVRLAVGARRSRLARQLVTESVLLAVLATALALPMVLGAGRFIPLLIPYGLSNPVGADARVFLFLIAVGMATGLLFGLAPAWAASGRAVTEALREGASTGGRARTRLRDALVVSQLALSLGLLAGAALLGRSVLNAASAEPGFRPEGLTAGFVNLRPTGRYDETTGPDLYARILDAVERIPGVRSATLGSQVPIAGGHSRRTVRPVEREEVNYEAEYTVIGPRYFETLGIPLLRGRTLGSLEDERERVVVVNEALARMFWPGENPIGKELVDDPPWRVVGLAGDVQMRSLRSEARPAVYYPMSQEYASLMAVHLLAEPGRRISAASLREAVAAVDPELPVSAVIDLQQALTDSMGMTRTIGYLVGLFAVLALALAAVGLYGLVSYGASQRVREMGIRIALGAEPGALVRLILAQGIAIAIVGVGAGMGVSLVLGRTLSGLLFGVAPTDLPTLGVAALLLLATAWVAAWIPARRASRVDAAVSLREE